MLLYYMKISFKYGGIYIWLMFFIQLFEGILPVLEMLLTAEFIDRTLELLQKKGSMEHILPLLFLFGLVIGFTWLIKDVEKFITIKLTHRLRERFRPVLVERIAKLPYKTVEEKAVQDHIHRIIKAPEKEIVDGAYQILGFITISIRMLGVVFLIGYHVWWCGIMLLLMNIPLIYLAKLNGETVYQANQEMSGYMRRYQYLEQLLNGREAMLERNLFGFRGFLQRKWEKVYDKAYHSYIRAFLKYFFCGKGIWNCVSSIFHCNDTASYQPINDRKDDFRLVHFCSFTIINGCLPYDTAAFRNVKAAIMEKKLYERSCELFSIAGRTANGIGRAARNFHWI